MAIACDPAKDAANVAKHGVSLARADDLAMVVSVEDARRDYGETRYRIYGEIDGVALSGCHLSRRPRPRDQPAPRPRQGD